MFWSLHSSLMMRGIPPTDQAAHIVLQVTSHVWVQRMDKEPWDNTHDSGVSKIRVGWKVIYIQITATEISLLKSALRKNKWHVASWHGIREDFMWKPQWVTSVILVWIRCITANPLQTSEGMPWVLSQVHKKNLCHVDIPLFVYCKTIHIDRVPREGTA